MGIVANSRATGNMFGPVGVPTSCIIVNDVHHDPIKVTDTTQGGKFYQDSIQKLGAIAAIANARGDLSFAFQNGDFIDGSASAGVALTDLAAAKAAFATNVPLYHNIGNHEVTRLTKAQIIGVTGQPSKWYSFVRGGVTWIVLDGNSTADNDTADLEVSAGTGATPYISYVPPTQRQWLADTISASPYPCVIFCHYPLYYVGAFGWGLTNAAAVRAILEAAGPKVIGCIGGHLHDNFIIKYNGIVYATIHATVTAAYPSLTYAIVSVYPGSRAMKVIAAGYDMTYVAA